MEDLEKKIKGEENEPTEKYLPLPGVRDFKKLVIIVPDEKKKNKIVENFCEIVYFQLSSVSRSS